MIASSCRPACFTVQNTCRQAQAVRRAPLALERGPDALFRREPVAGGWSPRGRGRPVPAVALPAAPTDDPALPREGSPHREKAIHILDGPLGRSTAFLELGQRAALGVGLAIETD